MDQIKNPRMDKVASRKNKKDTVYTGKHVRNSEKNIQRTKDRKKDS